jgi:uncharacterized membrane protein YkvA (DUF1232 family)
MANYRILMLKFISRQGCIMSDDNQFVGYFSDDGFWEKIVNYAKKAGKEVIEKGLWLYYAAQREDTPAWAKAVIYGALGYFILPLDAIPDVMPGIGYTDDLGVLAAAITTVASYIDDSVKELAREKIAAWFD